MSAKIIPFPLHKVKGQIIELTPEMLIEKGNRPLKAFMTDKQLREFLKAYGKKGMTLETAIIQASLSGFFSRGSIRD